MSDRIRHVDAFYEKDGEFAVPRDLAENLFAGAIPLVARYAGLIDVRLRPMNVGTTSNPLDIRRIKLGNDPHAGLFTRRRVMADGIVSRGLCLFGPSRDDVRVSRFFVSTAPTPNDMTNQKLTLVTAHELGHSFGLPECSSGVTTCVMNKTVESDGTTPSPDKIMRNPFCDSCIGALALARARLV